ncbi:MAG: hypothetical protein HKO65_01420 [Gemmatimonadetes bacterium]|nr:hypothetical protein [Gemmatimonadota bacterium]
MKKPIVLLALLMALSWPTHARCQTIRGYVLETQIPRRVPSASVMLLDTIFAVVANTTTNANGAFLLEPPSPGDHYVLVEALGYHPSLDGILEMGDGGSITIEYYIRPKPLELDSLVVAVQRVRAHRVLFSSGYYEREGKGFGYFVTPEEIEQRNPRYIQDLFQGIPGVFLDWGGGMGSQIAAVEAYTRASAIPLQYGGSNGSCGVVLIWTK